jgi:hypothetical protein
MHLSVALGVMGAIVFMGGVSVALAGEAFRLESAAGWRSFTSLGMTLIGWGLGLGVVFAVLVSFGFRESGRRLQERALRQAGEMAGAAERPAPAESAAGGPAAAGSAQAAPPRRPAGAGSEAVPGYSDDGWRLDGTELPDAPGQSPEVHHPVEHRAEPQAAHDTGQLPAYLSAPADEPYRDWPPA